MDDSPHYHPDWIKRKKQYIARIRNAEKKAYAQAYFNYLTTSRAEPKENEYECSTMAKQAVRMALREGL